MLMEGTIPYGYNLTSQELGNKLYPILESLPGRMRGAREMKIQLLPAVWRPHAVAWVQGLQVMTEVLEDGEF